MPIFHRRPFFLVRWNGGWHCNLVGPGMAHGTTRLPTLVLYFWLHIDGSTEYRPTIQKQFCLSKVKRPLAKFATGWNLPQVVEDVKFWLLRVWCKRTLKGHSRSEKILFCFLSKSIRRIWRLTSPNLSLLRLSVSELHQLSFPLKKAFFP